jgi:hypothetical protein
VRDAEQAANGQERLALTRERWLAFGATGLAWLAVAVALAFLSPRRMPAAERPPVTDAPEVPAPPASIDLNPVAALCTDLSTGRLHGGVAVALEARRRAA